MENVILFPGTNSSKTLGNKTSFYRLTRVKRKVESLIWLSSTSGQSRFTEQGTKRSQNEHKLFRSQDQPRIEETTSDLT